MADNTCPECGKATRALSDVLSDLAAVRACVHLAFHAPSISTGLREALELLASAESELHGCCYWCARREALEEVQWEMATCAQTPRSALRPQLVTLLEARQERSEARSRGLRLVKDEGGQP